MKILKFLVSCLAFVGLLSSSPASVAAGGMRILAAMQLPKTTGLQAANIATYPSFTTGSMTSLFCSSSGTLTIQVSGTYVGQLAFGSSLDGLRIVTYNNAAAISETSSTTGIAANATGKYTVSVGAGIAYVWLSAYTSGTASVTLSFGPTSISNPGSITGGLAPNAAQETGGNIASILTQLTTSVTRLTSILASLNGGLPAALASGLLKSNGVTVLTSYSSSEASNTVTTAATLTLSGGGDPSAPLVVIVTNTGTVDAWVSPVSGGHTWIIPAGSTVYLPVGSTSTLYGLSSGAATTLVCIKAGY